MSTLKAFREWQKEHPNFITPDVLKVKQNGNRFIELSEGRGIDHKTLYGVTVIQYNQHKDEFKIDINGKQNKCFHSLEEAEKHFGGC